jgi:hypothetical protein
MFRVPRCGEVENGDHKEKGVCANYIIRFVYLSTGVGYRSIHTLPQIPFQVSRGRDGIVAGVGRQYMLPR